MVKCNKSILHNPSIFSKESRWNYFLIKYNKYILQFLSIFLRETDLSLTHSVISKCGKSIFLSVFSTESANFKANSFCKSDLTSYLHLGILCNHYYFVTPFKKVFKLGLHVRKQSFLKFEPQHLVCKLRHFFSLVTWQQAIKKLSKDREPRTLKCYSSEQ